jgi:signal transduction histidine kinase
VSMRDRSEGLGGAIEVRSKPGKGTRVEVSW